MSDAYLGKCPKKVNTPVEFTKEGHRVSQM